jgi:prefoldin subunit 5
MTHTTFPEIQAATEALQSRIAITESEMAEMKESIAAKRQLVRSLRKALAAFNPKRAAAKKRATGQNGKSAASASS